MSKQHCRMLQYRMLLRHCCRFWQQCRSNVRLCYQKRQQCRTSFALKFRPLDKVERCFDNVAQNGNIVEATGTKVSCCFDNVASTLLLVWTGLKTTKPRITQTTVSCTIAHGLLFSEAKDLGEIATGSLPTGRQIEVGYVEIGYFRWISRYISETLQDRDTVNMSEWVNQLIHSALKAKSH